MANQATKKNGWSVKSRNFGKYKGTKVEKTLSNGENKTSVLLNPSKKAEKYKNEMNDRKHYTNDGKLKKDDSGNTIPLTYAQRAYRAGYFAARDDNAGAYLSDMAKKDPKNYSQKLAARNERKKAYYAKRQNKNK